MQTFLPYSDFFKTAQVLDRQRLGKQRVETLQLLSALAGHTHGWRNHPAAKMWKGYENCLIWYGIRICTEWTNRGYKDTCLDKIKSYIGKFSNGDIMIKDPPWLGDENFHKSHRSNLLRKSPEHYSRFFEQNLENDLPYIWPKI